MGGTIWLEMSNDPMHGGGGAWGLGRAVWAPTTKVDGTSWAFYSLIENVHRDDLVVHLRDAGNGAAFIGYSIAATDGYITTEHPTNLGPWSHASKLFRADLRDFVSFPHPIPLRDRFEQARDGLLKYYEDNKAKGKARRTLFYSKFGAGLRGVAGAYFSEFDEQLAGILFGRDFSFLPSQERPFQVSARTGEVLSLMQKRVGQREFSTSVLANFGSTCCFPRCDVRERAFLVGAHIVRWADDEGLRGEVSNGLCLCLLHDRAFELGWFVIDDALMVRVNYRQSIVRESDWAAVHLRPYDGAAIATSAQPPNLSSLQAHRLRVGFADYQRPPVD